MTAHGPLSTAFLLVETTKAGEPVWAVKWRSADGSRVRRRLGAHAWLVRDGSRGWRPRSGRPAPGHLTEYQARRRVVEFVESIEAERAATRAREATDGAAGGPTFRALAHAWLEHVEFVLGAKPTTLRDYRSMLAEPGTPYRRGRGATIGLRPEQADRWGLSSNPAAAAAKRREAAPARLEVFSVQQIEALARAAEAGDWRGPHDDLTDAGAPLRAEEDTQFAELLRVAAYTGLRRGELVALRWRDVRWSERILVVERALSGDVESTTKSGKVHYVPLGDQAIGALDRLSRRPNFTRADDYVFATVAGDRPDPSALRRRFIAARDAAGLPSLRFHDLRHTAVTLLTRVLDPVTVRDVLGHADLKTTERYLHAVHASRLSGAATRAFTIEPAEHGRTARAALVEAVSQLEDHEARRLLTELTT